MLYNTTEIMTGFMLIGGLGQVDSRIVIVVSVVCDWCVCEHKT